MSKDNATMVKALRRLMSSILDDTADDLSRVEMLEEALSYAALVLNSELPASEALREQLDTVAVQMVVDKVDREDLKVYQVGVTCEHDEHIATVVATTDGRIAAEVGSVVEKHAKRASSKKTTDYSIN